MNVVRSIAAALIIVGAFAGPAMAADAPQTEPAAATDWSPWLVRARAIAILPNSSAKFNVSGSAHVSDQVVPELDISYFFTPNFAVEAICCATKHTITGRGAFKGVDVGDTWVVPATVTAQYHFTDFGAFRPYVGVGVNYSIYFGEDPEGGVVTRLKIKNSFGPAAQVGFDYFFHEHWGINFDLKYIHMKPKVELTAGGADISGRAKINPWVVGTGVTYKF